jgi:hypothetical protein
MDISRIPTGSNPPAEVNAVIEIPQGGVPVKYELDKEFLLLIQYGERPVTRRPTLKFSRTGAPPQDPPAKYRASDGDVGTPISLTPPPHRPNWGPH